MGATMHHLRVYTMFVALVLLVAFSYGDESCLAKEGCCCCHCAGGNKCGGKICCHPDDVCTTADGTVFDVRAQQAAALKAHEEEQARRSAKPAVEKNDAKTGETKKAEKKAEAKKKEDKKAKKSETKKNKDDL